MQTTNDDTLFPSLYYDDDTLFPSLCHDDETLFFPSRYDDDDTHSSSPLVMMRTAGVGSIIVYHPAFFALDLSSHLVLILIFI